MQLTPSLLLLVSGLVICLAALTHQCSDDASDNGPADPSSTDMSSGEREKSSVLGPYAPQVCSLPRDTGPCRGFFWRYYYNGNTGECEEFVFGGCGGNGNNFKYQEDCEKACKSVTTEAN